MKDASIKVCVGIGAIVAVYGIYTFSNPGTDGYVFGSVLAAVSALAGYTIAAMRKASE